MPKLHLKTRFFDWKNDTRGAFSMIWASSTMCVLMATGAAYDFSNMAKHKEAAQQMADSMALAASIAVDQHNKDKLVEDKLYKFDEITGRYEKSLESLRGSVKYDVVDDLDPANADGGTSERLLARATVTGNYVPAFMSILPQFKSIEYDVTSDVAYGVKSGIPASVFFAVDNSGSMGWLDSSGTNKLLSLESSLRGFMAKLDAVNNANNDIFRTALYPYSADYENRNNSIDEDGVIPNRVVAPAWGTISTGKINSMTTLQGTDSSGALEDAEQAFVGETAIHVAKNQTNEPLKFMIFMSDGSNNSSYECKTEQVWVDGEEYWIDTYRGWNTRYNRYERWFDSWVVHYPASEGGWEDKETCSTDYHADTQSIASCNAMKNDGVTVYSIGYALIAGVNGVSNSEVTRAKNLLESCATSTDHYVLASNASQLNAAFDEIGEQIVEEVVRVKR